MRWPLPRGSRAVAPQMRTFAFALSWASALAAGDPEILWRENPPYRELERCLQETEGAAGSETVESAQLRARLASRMLQRAWEEDLSYLTQLNALRRFKNIQEELASKWPDEPGTLIARGEFHQYTPAIFGGDRARAREFFARARAASTDSEILFAVLLWHLNAEAESRNPAEKTAGLRQAEEIIALLEKRLAERPADAKNLHFWRWLPYQHGVLLFHRGRFAEAKKFFEDHLMRFADSPWGWYFMWRLADNNERTELQTRLMQLCQAVHHMAVADRLRSEINR